LGPRGIGGFNDCAGRRTARPHDDAGPFMGNLALLETGVADRLLHRDMIPGSTAAEEPHGAAVDRLVGVQRRRARHLAAKPKLSVLLGAHYAGFGLAQARQNLLGIVPDRRDDAHPGDDDTSHGSLSGRLRMPLPHAPVRSAPAITPRSPAAPRPGGTGQ